MNNKFRRVSIWSGPGAGKSVVASQLFSDLKLRNHNVELIQEYIKKLAYEGIKPRSFDACYIFGKQLHSEDLFLQNVDVVVTDSPVAMNACYCIKHGFPSWRALLDISLEFDKKYPSLNIFLERGELPYQQVGRYENYEQALEMDDRIKSFLNDFGFEYTGISVFNYQTILNHVLENINE